MVNLARSGDHCEGWQPSDPGWGSVWEDATSATTQGPAARLNDVV